MRRLGVDRYRVEEGGVRLSVGVERLGPPTRERGLETEEWRLSTDGASWRTLSLVQGRAHHVEVEGVPHRFTRDHQGLVRGPGPGHRGLGGGRAGRRGPGRAAPARARGHEDGDLGGRASRGAGARGRGAAQRPGRSRRPPGPHRPRAAARGRSSRGAGCTSTPSGRPGAGPRRAGDRRSTSSGGCFWASTSMPPACARCSRAGAERGGGRGLHPRGGVAPRHLHRRVLALPPPGGRGLPRRGDGERGVPVHLPPRPRRPGRRAAADASSPSSERALAHYGVTDLDPSPELEESLHRLCKAHQREEQLVAPVSLLLDRILETGQAALEAVPELPALLDRVTAATQSRYPAVNDLAREVRFRLVEKPLLERVRAEALAEAEAHVEALRASADVDERASHVEGLVRCPSRWRGCARSGSVDAPPVLESALLEVLLRRFYRIRAPRGRPDRGRRRPPRGQRRLRPRGAGPAGPGHPRRRGRARREPVSPGPRGGGGPRGDRPRGRRVRVASRRAWETPTRTPPPSAPRSRPASLARPFHRMVCVVAGPGAVQHFTFRPAPDGGYVEETLYRDAHPMIGQAPAARAAPALRARAPALGRRRLRLPGGGQGEPPGRAPVRGGRGPGPDPGPRCLGRRGPAARARADAPRGPGCGPPGPGPPAPGRRLVGNRVLLHVWPVLDLPDSELHAFVDRYAPVTDGLALEGVTIQGRVPDPEGGPPRPTVLFLAKPPGRPAIVRREELERRADPAAERVRPEGRASRPAGPRLPLRAGEDVGPGGAMPWRATSLPASSWSTTSTTTGGCSPSTGPSGRTRPTSSWG